jgi:DNA polymerase-1
MDHITAYKGDIGLDTETTGLSPYSGDRLFSIIIHLGAVNESYYFNFQDYGPQYEDYTLKLIPTDWTKIFQVQDRTVFAHNAKFDLHFLNVEKIKIPSRVHCTEAIARLVWNTHMSYSLDDCVKRDLGLAKDDKVKAFMDKHKLYTMEKKPGAKTRKKNYHYDKVPLEIIGPYGIKDADLTYRLGVFQIEEIDRIARDTIRTRLPLTLKDLYEIELKLTTTLFKCEAAGMSIDVPYTQKALAHQYGLIQDTKRTFEQLAGMPLVDSAKGLTPAFEAAGEQIHRTEKGNPSFKDEVLEKYNTPLVRALREFRGAEKKANTYFSSFLYLLGNDGRIHTNLRQGGTSTGRLSCAQPNLQNLNKEKLGSSEYLVRQCFNVEPDYCLFMPDMDQMEYRLMLDYANEISVIDKILLDGMDVHTATASMLRISRDLAKTLNFALLYGAGIAKIAFMLKITEGKARILVENYFLGLPAIKIWIRNVINTAKRRGYLISWHGRVFRFEPSFAYKGPNALIQGGCGDAMKVAMNDTDDFVSRETSHDSKMLMQVHDELIFKIHKSELDLCPEIVRIMQEAYPYKRLPLTATPAYSWDSWAHKQDGYPSLDNETRNKIQKQDTALFRPFA